MNKPRNSRPKRDKPRKKELKYRQILEDQFNAIKNRYRRLSAFNFSRSLLNTETRPSTNSPENVLFSNGMWMGADSSGNVGIFNASGTKTNYLDTNGFLNFTLGVASVSVPSTFPFIGTDTSNNLYIQVASTKALQINNALVINQAGKITNYNNVSTTGLGLPAIYATVVQSASNAAPTSLSYTPPSTAGTYRITAYLDVTTATTITFKNKLTYTDPAGNARTDIPIWELEGSATLLVAPTANTADRFVQGPYVFGIDNSGTAITLVDNAGTYTTCAYRYQVLLEQLI